LLYFKKKHRVYINTNETLTKNKGQRAEIAILGMVAFTKNTNGLKGRSTEIPAAPNSNRVCPAWALTIG